MFERALAEVTHDPAGWITIALLLGCLVMAFPWRHTRTIVTRRTFNFPPEAVWVALRAPHPSQISETRDPSDPDVAVCTFKRPLGGVDSPPIVLRLRVLLDEPPLRHVVRFEDVNGRPFPFGLASTLSEAIRPTKRGCEVIVIFEGELNSSFHALWTHWSQTRGLSIVARALRKGTAPVPVSTKQEPPHA